MKKYIVIVLALILSLSMVLAVSADQDATEEKWEDVFEYWNPEAPALNTLIEYVENVTDESSEDFIPVADRIAIFDMDGTLYGEMFPTYLGLYALAWRILEDPGYQPDEEMLEFGREIRESVRRGSYADDFTERYINMFAKAFAGMTLAEYSEFITQLLLQDVDGFEGMTYGEAFYLPMLEVIEYLQDNDFTVYVCSGSDRFLCRTLLEGIIGIPYANIIGMDVAVEAAGQNGEDGLYYVYSAEDDILRTDKLIIYNVKMNKVLQIVQEIGRQPVLSFGNSSGDMSMHNYTIYNNPYKSMAFMLIADDEERDYGYEPYTQMLGEQWEAYGYNTISIREDFLTIYGEDVVRTGVFNWLSILSDDRD